MVSSVSSMGNSMAMMQSRGMQGPPPPKDKDVFQVGDTDGDGLISTDELTAIAEGIEEISGNSINVDDAIASYDANQDGGLSGEELLEMLKSNGFSPPEMMGEGGEGGGDESSMRPPPPPADQALAAYGQNSGDDQIAQLLEMLQNGDSEEGYTSVDVTS